MRPFRFAIAAVLFVSLACSREMEPSYICELDVSCETKVSLSDDCKTVWNSNDALSVFYGNETNSLWYFKGDDGSRAGKIEGPGACVLDGRVFALYPYYSGASLMDGQLETILPEEQQFRENSYSSSSVIMYSAGNSNPLLFRYATAIAVLNLGVMRTCTIDSIDFSSIDGRDVSGTFQVNPSNGATSVSGSDKIRMSYGESITEGESESFYFCIPPGDYESGIQFTIHFDGAPDRIVRYASPLSIKGGELLTVKDIYCRTYAVDIDFTTNSPFEQKLPTTVYQGTMEYTFNSSELGALSFAVSSTKGGFRFTNNMLRVNDGVDAGDAYIRIPHVPGLILSSVSVLISNQSGRAFKVGTAPGLADIVGEQNVPSGISTSLALDFSGADCYLSVSAKNTQILNIGLLYY